jgi:CheY-like chemotaxis protein
MKILVVDPDVNRAPALKMALAAGGAEVTVASSGSFALTMLEWNRQDVVVSRARIDDMDGHELCAILKADPGTRDVRFVLVAGTDEVTAAQTTAAGVDLVVPPTMAAGALVPLVVRVKEGDAAPAPAGAITTASVAAAPAEPPPARAAAPPAVPRLRPAPNVTPLPEPPKAYVTPTAAAAAAPWSASPPAAPPAPSAPPPPAAPPVSAARAVVDLQSMPSGTFQGSLDVMDLADLTQAIAGGGKTGRLILALPRGGGLIAFETGRVVHAEYRGTVGEEAFGGLLAAAHGDGTGRFCFLPSAKGEAPCAIRTIDKSVDRLLLSIATAIDEKG